MKSDQYLTHCLEQASLSTLRFRHGSIIVKGGKVIGQGFNDYRPGFDGGALKTGILPLASFPFVDTTTAAANNVDSASTDGNAKPKNPSNAPLTQFELLRAGAGNNRSGGGGSTANTSLSMHSEMMAVQSALAASSTLAAGAVSRTKPYLKLPGDSKAKRALRREAVRSYAESVLQWSARGNGWEVQESDAAGQGQQQGQLQRKQGGRSGELRERKLRDDNKAGVQGDVWRFEPAAYRFAGSSEPGPEESSSESERERASSGASGFSRGYAAPPGAYAAAAAAA
jgi:hypothetical protein